MASLWPPLTDTAPDLSGKVILVTGGTGSFGRAFVTRVLAQHAPAKLIVFSRDEQKHFAMQREMDDPRLRFFVGDIRDRSRLLRALRGVDIVIHAAAMKHVPLAEYNPIEAIRTNVDGAANLIDAALEREVEVVVGLSTDKAASPVNLYGATKLCMEKLLVAANSYSGQRGPKFKLVRYGNVVGSKGSVLPLFLNQRETGTLTLTEPAMTRFWIRMDQAIDLVMLTLMDGQGGEVFVPKIPACTVATLADAVAPDAEKKVIGIRPGEKIHELMITPDESRNVLEYARHFVITPSFPWWGGPKREGSRVADGFQFSSDIAEQLDTPTVRAMLREIGYPV
ncbi:UDP-N-acetylglucosamine 4,6-dehydratase [Enhygromyxa salina]|uniref:UDP-N-acetylglucosamine 4,6-dehydratase n=1 Tax=Enhygromyxa salina TaxID=215803 RepID=A0A2S9XFI2_9BACT|nr:UDP-N-acetylglucosamine 4,6-dehydratase (inverting) [Enhygromyxa salina]PRP91623.1 UDP-N-acetylglucosamine 4,6-dehydratase [Enhygromyxa salina]